MHLIFYRMGQRGFVRQYLRKVSAIEPATTCWAADEMLGLILGRIANAPADEFAAGEVGHCCRDAGNTVSWPVCRSLTATLPLGF
jgi:hypothetical protein